QAQRRRRGRLGDPDRPPGTLRRERRQARGALSRGRHVEAGRADPLPATGGEKGNEVRAVVYGRYGPPEVLHLEELGTPAPKDDEVLVHVHASSVTRTDAGLRGAEFVVTRYFTGVLRPKPERRIVGMEFAGEIAAIGRDVTTFAVGDRVFGVR